MSSRQTFFLTGGVMGLVIVLIVMFAYFGQEARNIAEDGKQQSQANAKAISDVNNTLNQFVDKWFGRVEKSNVMNNYTQQELLKLGKGLDSTENNILGNLTRHRIVANETRDLLINFGDNILDNITKQIDRLK